MFTIPADQVPLIQAASDKHGYPYNLLASQGYQESGLNPACKSPNYENGVIVSWDRGWAEINSVAHPEVSDAQAFDMAFAIDWMASTMRGLYDQYGSWYLALLAYNGGAGAVIAYKAGNPYNKSYADRIFNDLARFDAIWPVAQKVAVLCGDLYGMAMSEMDKQKYHALANEIRQLMGWPESLPVSKITIG